MQITIVQAEIEDAIKAYVTGQIALKPGQEVTIDLKATRGAEGYQAIINVGFPAENAASAAAQTKTAYASKPVITTADLKRMQAEEAAADETNQGGEDAGEGDEAGSDNGAETVVEAEAPAAVTEPAPTAVAATPKKRLFGNVVRPNNA